MKQIELNFQRISGLDRLPTHPSIKASFFSILHKNRPRDEGSISVMEGKEYVGVGVEFDNLPLLMLNTAVVRDLGGETHRNRL
jgi:hypothetical protein